jgi:cellulose 1,4-beta-cellobiosidase
MSQQYSSPRRRIYVRLMSGYLTVLAVFLLTLVTPGAPAQTHVANPYSGAMVYVNPDYTAEVATAEAADPSLAGKMATVAKQPTFVWLDHIAAITAVNGNGTATGRMSLQQHINAAVAQANGAEIVVQLVIYDLPQRDCAALASNGELSIAGGDVPIGGGPAMTGTGIQEYENYYITPIYNILKAAPSNVRFVLVIEDDSLPNLITNSGLSFTDAPCVAANGGVSNAGVATSWTQTATPTLNIPSTGVYYQGITFAANTFHKLPNAYNYLDIGHHGWLGWTSNTAYAVQFFSSFAQQLSAGYATIDGFITNTANYGPLTEPYIVWDEVAGGPETSTSTSSGIFTGDFYQWNPAIDELSYKTYFLQALTASATAGYTDPRGQAHTPGGGFPSTIGFLIDTSRNGWGNTSVTNGGGTSAYQVRPTAAGTSTNIDTFVNESKIDLRNSSGQWCNQENAGIGVLPVVNPTSGVSAYVWVKPPGEADGTYPGSTYYSTTNPETGGDPNCNPVTANPQAGADTIANSIPNSPTAGTFWLTEFEQLVEDAYPVLASSGGGGFTLTPASTSVTLAQGASTTDAITIADTGGFTGTVTLTASSSNSGVTVTVSGDTLTLKASSTATGTATISVTGISGSTSATTSVAVTVNAAGFTLTPASAAVTLAQGASTTDAITVTDNGGFTGTVTLTASSSNSGVTVTVSGDTLTLKASSTASGTATITVNGASGSTTATTSITVTVTPVGFTLAPASAAVSLNQGASTTDAITVTDTGGFTGTVTLTASSSNSGVTVTVSGDTLTLKASSTASGTATITVNGASGSTTATTSITVTVTPVGFTLAPASAAVSLNQGASTTDAITVTDTGGFTGTVTLTASSSNSGVTVTVSGDTLTLKASSTASGTATITVNGASGSTIATTSITVTVTPTGGACEVDYAISPQNTSQFGATINIKNNSGSALSNWSLTWSFANGQTIANSWNGAVSQSGGKVTVSEQSGQSWQNIPANGSYSGFGFNGTWNGTTNAIPTAFSLNGTACTVN